MPNHCCNTLTAAPEIVYVILNNYVVKSGGELFLDFERIVPVGCADNEERIVKWGTKWVGYDVSAEDNRTIRFSTAWFPPIPIIKALARLYHDYVFYLDYYEPGNNFRGTATTRWGGKEVVWENRCWNMAKADRMELCLSDNEIGG